MKSIYDLGLHDRMSLGAGLTVTRVPGGWIYNNVFVPYSEEFKGSDHTKLPFFNEAASSMRTIIKSQKEEPEFVNVVAPGDTPERVVFKITDNNNGAFIITGKKKGKLK